MKTSKHITRGILCTLLVVLCIAALAACTFYETHEHQMSEWQITKAPTCTESGEKARECKDCGQKETIAVNALGHNWQAATCDAPGTCANCGATSGEAIGHRYTLRVENANTLKSAAACEQAAIYYKSCACGAISNSDQDTFASGSGFAHIFDKEVVEETTLKSAATCTSAAIYYKSCFCGAVSTNEADIFFVGTTLDHVFDQEVAKYAALKSPATETEAALYYKSCVCGLISNSDEDVFTYGNPGDHTHIYDIQEVEPTCSEYGYTTYVCDCGYSHTEMGDTLLEHTWVEDADPMLYLAKDATCTTVAEYYYSCSVCGTYNDAPDAQTFLSGEVLGHYYVWISNQDGTHTGICQNYGCQDAITNSCAGGAATCMQKAVCELCQEYYGEALGHNWVDGNVISPATCTVAGQKAQVCQNSGCNATTTVAIPVTGHNYQSVVKAPSCTEQGYTTYTCQNAGCTHSYQSDYVANGHSWNIDAPTCTEAQVCSVCQVQNDAIGHSYTLLSATTATCTQAATNTYRCTNCDNSYTESVGTPTAHNIAGVTPTLVPVQGEACLYVEHYACADCSTDVVGNQVEKHGKYAASIQTAATCTTEGVKVLTCADCGETKTEAIPVDTTLGHNWITGSVVDGKRVDTCNLCDATKSVKVVTENQTNKTEDLKDTELSIGGTNINFGQAADSIGNQTQNDVTIGAGTLAEDEKQNLGLNEEKLSQIGDNPIYNFTVTDTEDNKITQFGDDVYVTITIPYALKDGEDVDSIAVWFISDTGEIETIPAVYNNGFITFKTNHFSYYTGTSLTPAERCEVYGHNYKFSDPVEPTCIEEGYTLKYCIRCLHSEKIDLVDRVGHNYSTSTVKEANCKQEGLVRHTCLGCHTYYEERTPALEHNYEYFSETDSTCTVAGAITYKCTNCNGTKSTQKEPLGHDHQQTQVVAPTCDVAGYTVYTCSRCPDSYTANPQNPVGHNYVATWEWADDNASATISISCQNAGCRYQAQPFTDVVVAKVDKVDSDEKKEGRIDYTVSYVFDGKTYTDSKREIIPVKEHDHSNCPYQSNKDHHWYKCSYASGNKDKIPHEYDEGTIVKEANCRENGKIVYTCICGREKEEIIPKTDTHTAGEKTYRDGEKHWNVCTVCNLKFNEATHTWGEGTETQKLTCTTDGIITYQCACGESKTQKTPAPGHTEVILAGKEANCTESGLTEGKMCSACDTVLVQQEVIPAYGHNFEGGNCTHCGISEIPEHEHLFDNACDPNCNFTGCDFIRETAHVWSHDCDTTCNVCGYTRQTEHVWSHDCDNTCDVYGCGYTRKTQHVYDNACDTDCNVEGCGYTRKTKHAYDNDCDTDCNVCGATREVPDHVYSSACDATCNACGYTREVAGHIYDNVCDNICNICGVVREVPPHQYQDGVCINCGAEEVADHEHSVVDGRCEICGYIPVFENASVYDNDGDGVCDVYYFTPILPEQFTSENAIHVWAGTNESPVGSFNTATFSEITHWYCIEGKGHYLLYTVEVPEAGIYEMAVHTRMKDNKERGAMYIVNEGTEYEYTFETSYQFETNADAFEARENDYTMSSYMFGIYVDLQEGKNTIKIQDSSKSPKNQHFRDFYFVKVDGCAHEYVETARVDAGCTNDGYVTKVCSVCGLERTWTLQATGHAFDKTVANKEPTCTADGYVTKACSVCNFEETWTLEATGHSFGETTLTKEPTCTEDGERQGVCGNCGQIATDIVPATGHYREYERVEFADLGITCGGYGYRYVCKYCKQITSSYSNDYYCSWSQTAYDEQTNTTTYTCSTCGAVKKYSSVTEYSDTCNYTHVQTYEYYVNGTLVWNRQSTGSGASHTYSYTFELQGTSCTDGYYVTTTCKDCGYSNGRSYGSSHNTYRVEYYDFTECGACYGYVSLYSCACGQEGWMSSNWCCYNHVSSETYKDNAGVEHTVEIYTCPSCGLTRIQNYYDQREGCYTYRFYTYTVKMGDATICSYEQQSQSSTHHDYVYTYVFDDENNKNCEAGVTVTRTCRNCGLYSESHRTSHSTNRIAKYDFVDYGAEGGYVSIYECPCGYYSRMEWNSCSHGYYSTSSKHTDENGIRWTVNTYTSACSCKIRIDRNYYYTYDTTNCTRTTYYVDSVVVGDRLVTLYEHTNTEEYHDYVISASLKPGSVTCNDGAVATYTCRNCSHTYTENYSWHNMYEVERIDMASHGSVCGGYISIRQCACGYSANWSFDDCNCDFEHRNTNDWIEGDIDRGQETADGWNGFYTDSYVYTCAITHPEQCGFTIRYSDYWKKNSNCSATHYLTLQFGYDELNGTYTSQKTIELETRTYHNYQETSLTDGHKYECSDCGSYYTQLWYYNTNGQHIKTEQIWVNTLNDGCNKRREYTYEYYQGVDSRWNGREKTSFYKYTYADGTEWWDKYEYTYGDYTAPFGENAYTKTQVYTNSNGSTQTNEYAYTRYKGYEFRLYEHHTNGNYWHKYDYTYDFTGGCSRTLVYTDSNGSNQTYVEDAHSGWYQVTIKAPTCTQYGLQGYRCPVCEEVYNTEEVLPTSHNWVLLPTGVYYCYNCGLQGANGASGSIVMEDLTDKYGNDKAYVIGYWQKIPFAFTPYVTIYLHEPQMIDGVPEDTFLLYTMSSDKFHFVNDQYVGLYVNKADIDAAVAELCRDWNIATFTRDMYDVAISFVPDGADSNFDYAIVFGDLAGTEGIDYIIRNDEFLTDYIPSGGYKEYTIISDKTVEWVFESYALQDTYVHLYDENGRELARDDDSAGHNNNFRLSYTLEAGKTYIVRVRWYGTDRAGYIPVSFDKRG